MVLSLKQGYTLSLALLMALLLVLNACGTNVSSPGSSLQTPAGDQPERVQIKVETVSLNGGKHPLLTLTQTLLVRRLYSVVQALPALPSEQACTDELGPSYTLIFWHGRQRLTALTAQRFSCQVVTVEGVSQERRATPDFWSLVDQAIYAATPAGTPRWLSIMHISQKDQPPLTARLTSIETTRQLYNAIQQQPLVSPHTSCSDAGFSAYTLLFHQADLTIPSLINQQCNTIDLEGDYRTRSGTFIMTNAFKQLLQQKLAEAAFALAQPDQLALTLVLGNSTVSSQQVTDIDLAHNLYARAFTLPLAPASLPQTCNEQDKVNGKGRWYSFDFRQWGLLLLHMELFEGSCRLITLYPSGKFVWGDASFWNLVHQAAQI